MVSAGTSDAGPSQEAVRVLRYYGEQSVEVHDVGVAGLWRLLERIEEIREMPVILVVAGMDGALTSVVGGLVSGVVIAVPTSTGYGTAEKGRTALYAALTSCSSGIVVVNIDNGYGAGMRGAANPQIDPTRSLASGASDGRIRALGLT